MSQTLCQLRYRTIFRNPWEAAHALSRAGFLGTQACLQITLRNHLSKIPTGYMIRKQWGQMWESNPRLKAYETCDLTVCPIYRMMISQRGL